MNVRIGTRGSDLALWQARWVAARLVEAGHGAELVVLETRGDRIDDVPLHKIEGKAFFTAEIESALLRAEVDVAVHSHKDLPVEEPAELTIAAVPERGPAGERLLVRPESWDDGRAFLPLANGVRVGTSAPRRTEQLVALRPDLVVEPLRGNVPTRVRRLREGRYDAIVLARAGLDRLGLDTSDLRCFDLPFDTVVPAPAQGALAIQVRRDDHATFDLVRELFHDPATAAAIAAERALLLATGGGCSLPLGCLIEPVPGGFRGVAFVGPDVPRRGAGSRWLEATGDDPRFLTEALHRQATDSSAVRSGPLSGMRIGLVGSAEPGSPSEVGERLAALGASVGHERVLAFETVDDGGTLDRALAALVPGDAVAVTSREAARRIAGRAIPPGIVVGAVGSSTARVLRAAGIEPDHVGDGGSAELAGDLPVGAGARVVYPCAVDALSDLEEGLTRRGVEVERCEIYRTVAIAPGAREAFDVRLYMSPSAVRANAEFERSGSGSRRVALGETTAGACRDLGLPVDASGDRRVESVVRLLAGAASEEREVMS